MMRQRKAPDSGVLVRAEHHRYQPEKGTSTNGHIGSTTHRIHGSGIYANMDPTKIYPKC